MKESYQNDNLINKTRHIDLLYNYIKDQLFWNSELSKNEIWKLMEPINSIYTSVKMKTFWTYRENNERVLLHYRETAYIIIDNFKHLNLNKIQISLLHDLIEDTNISFQTINELYWTQIALWIEAISKKPIFNFIDNKTEYKKIIDSWIIDKHWDLTKKIKENILFKKNKLSYLENNATKYFDKAKEKRKIEYFSRFKSKDSMKKYIIQISKENQINWVNNEELNQIVLDVFDVKFADRIHNLKTQWDPENIKKVRKKVKETQDYLLPIAKNINIDAMFESWNPFETWVIPTKEEDYF
jgi:(p)ppGpp synthase/HD superfamily hydrolase